MQNIYYSAISILAIVIHLIINNEFIGKKRTKPHIADREYRMYLHSVFIYYITDALWGMINEAGSTTALYIDTVLYNIATVSTIILWCFYVITYLQMGRAVGMILRIIAGLFWLAEIVLLIFNHYVHIFFWFDENGQYHVFLGRYIAMVIQIILFSTMAVVTLIFALRTEDESRRRKINICIFGVAMVVTVLIQIMYPTLPFYAMGLMTGTCVLHVFVLEDEKDDYRRKLKENSDIIANTGYGIWKIKIDSDDEYNMTANDTLQDILGITGMNMGPRELYRFYHDRLFADVEEIENDDYRSMYEGMLRSRVLAWDHPAKGKIYITAGGTSHIEENGDVIIYGYCGDITSQQMESENLKASLKEEMKRTEAAMREAEAANKAKTSFLFNMSHDIRTPMNAIIGFTELMEKGIDDPVKCRDYISKIKSSSQFLLTLINNVLEMARIESGHVVIDESVCDLEEFTKTIYAVFEEQMKQKNIEFRMETDVEHPGIIGDEVKLREVYLNLLSNAFKYTNAGGSVTIRISELPSDKEGYGDYQAVISDTGVGMSKDFLPHIFNEFSREGSYTDTKIQGTGLGMAIVKQYVDLMDGTIDVDSEPGKGTTFTLRIRHRIAEKPDAEEKSSDSQDIIACLKGKRILLAEDNELNAEIAIEILSEFGIETDLAEDGIECVDKLVKSEPGRYDLILMDIQMPNLNGYEAAKRIRRLEDRDKATIPIIAMTANAFEEDRQNALKAGMNDHLTKPIEIRKLAETLVYTFNLSL